MHRILTVIILIALAVSAGCEQTRRQEITRRINAAVDSAKTRDNLELAVNLLLKEASSEDSFTRMKAINGIGLIGEKHGLGDAHATAVEALCQYLCSDDNFVRRECALALLRTKGDLQLAVHPLIETVKRQEPMDSAWFAAEALGKLGKHGVVAVPVLQEASRGREKHLASIAAASLKQIEYSLQDH